MTNLQWRWLERRQAIGHLKMDHRMNRCWLAESLSDALHAVLCAAGYNLRWLLRAVVRGRIKRLFFALCLVALQAMFIASALLSSSKRRSANRITSVQHDSQWLPSAAAAG